MRKIIVHINKTVLVACILFGVILVYGAWMSGSDKKEVSSVVIAGHEFGVELADTAKEREQGLSGRESIADGAGMLFVFPEPVMAGFWMRGMKFPIDIIWIADDRVVGVVEQALPDGGVKLFYPPQPIQYALEVQAGTVVKLRIMEGAEVRVLD